MSADTKLAIMLMFIGFIGFPLSLWLLFFWVDHSDDYVGRRCRKANQRYYEWEQRQKSKSKRRRRR